MDRWIDISLVVFGFLVGGLGEFCLSYFKMKGKNLATKEDIEEITGKIENVRHDYAQRLEAMKVELEQHLKINSFRYEKEFSVLVELAEAVHIVREYAKEYGMSALTARRYLANQKHKSDFQQKYNEAYAALWLTAERYRPFYSGEIYDLILEFEKFSSSSTALALFSVYGTPERQGELHDKVEDYAKAATEMADKIVEAIRQRVVSWEQV